MDQRSRYILATCSYPLICLAPWFLSMLPLRFMSSSAEKAGEQRIAIIYIKEIIAGGNLRKHAAAKSLLPPPIRWDFPGSQCLFWKSGCILPRPSYAPIEKHRKANKSFELRNSWSNSCSLYWKTMTHDYLNWPNRIKWFHLSLGKVGCAWCRCMYLRKTVALEIRTQIYCPYEHLPSRISAEQLAQLVSYHQIS